MLRLAAIATISAAALAAVGDAQAAALAGAEVTWHMSDLTVIDGGTTEVTAAGTLVKNYVVQGRAKAGSEAIIPEGTLLLTLSAFSPAVDTASERVGRWYVRGHWVLNDVASPDGAATRNPAGSLSGYVQAELAFNPAAEPNLWMGRALLPSNRFTPIARTGLVRPVRGEGLFTLVPSRHGGTLSLRLKL